MQTPRTVIIVPCYNEAKRLDTKAFQVYAQARPWLHFLFVNDGSFDQTLSCLREACAPLPAQLHFLHLPRNQGKAEAVRQGFLAAFQMDCAFAGFWDADLATPLEHIEDFVLTMQERSEVDLILGSRVKLLGRDIQRHPVRHYLGRVFATCTSVMLQLPVYDTQCGAKLFRCSEALVEAFQARFEANWVFDVEILARLTNIAKRRGQDSIEPQLLEYPLLQWTDVPGSKIRPKDFLRSGFDLLKIADQLYRRG